MEILIKNLGSIKNNKQTIDLSKRLYVFVGNNNSGKTYVSQLIWTIVNEGTQQKFARQTDINFNFDKDSFEVTEEIIDDVLVKYANFIKQELALTYGVENTNYKDTILGNFSLEFIYDINKIFETPFEATVNFREDEGDVINVLTLKKEKKSYIVKLEEADLTGIPNGFPKNRINTDKEKLRKSTFILLVISKLLDTNSNTLFLPANRSFYATFYQYIYKIERERREKEISKLIDMLDNKRKNKNEEIDFNSFKIFKKPYTKPINDLFEKLYDFNKDAKETKSYTKLVERISELIGGEIITSSLEGISMIDFNLKIKDTNKSLPMYLSSSSVNQLTLIYLYLKYWADKEDNFLLIDEPEENLNPKNQIKLLEILIDFANQSNNKVLITTHSPIIAESINNYSYLDILKNELKLDVKEIIKENKLKHINSNTSIAKENVGVYFFDGKKIIHYDDNEYGISFDNFREISTSMENNSKILTDYIYLQKQAITETNG